MTHKPFTCHVDLPRLTIWKATALPDSDDIRFENCCLNLLLSFIAVKLNMDLRL